MRMCSVEVMHNFKGLHARGIPLEFINKLLRSDCYPYFYLSTLFIVTVFGFLFVCFLARILCVLFVCMNKVDHKMYFKYSVFKRDSFYNCTRHDYSVNIQVSCLIIFRFTVQKYIQNLQYDELKVLYLRSNQFKIKRKGCPQC